MKKVTGRAIQLGIIASLFIISLLITQTTVQAQDSGGGSFGGSFTTGVPTPPTDEEACGDANGNWHGNDNFGRNCRDWDGEDQWAEFVRNSGLDTEQACLDRGGEVFYNRGNPDTYDYCRDFDGYDELVAQAESGEAPSLSGEEGEEEFRECNTGALGWILCPLVSGLAVVIDSIYGILVAFVRFPPVTVLNSNGQETATYHVCQAIRNLANIVFVLLMIVALFSQISNMGISNYGLKRILPRVIISSVLVNLSFYIAQIAVDLSNILGQSVYGLLSGISSGIFIDMESNSSAWVDVVTLALAGGVGVAGATGGISAIFATFAGSALVGAGAASTLGWIIAPIALMAVIAIFTAFVILGLRFVLVYVFIVISPLAFVAYLLPNTAKWFDRWQDIFITLLLFYPLFSLLFGMSDIVSRIMLASVDEIADEGTALMGVVMVFFGLFIQVAPLFLSYKLLRTANSLAGSLTNGMQRQGSNLTSRVKGISKDRSKQAREIGSNKLAAGNSMAGRSIMRRRLKKQEKLDRSKAWENKAQGSEVYARGMDDGAREADYDAKSTAAGLSRTQQQYQAEYVKHLGTDTQARDANGNPIDGKMLPNAQAQQAAGAYYQHSSSDAAKQMMIDEVTRGARASQTNEEIKEYKAMLSGSAVADLKTALQEAIKSDDVAKAQASQSLLFGMGGFGANTFVSTVEESLGSGKSPDSAVMQGMQQNIRANHGDIKGTDNSIMEWGIHGGTIKGHREAPGFGSNLNDTQTASQSPDVLRAMSQTRQDDNGNTVGASLTPDAAGRMLSNPDIQNKLKDEQRVILEEVSAGKPAPTNEEFKSIQAAKQPQPQTQVVNNNQTQVVNDNRTTNQNNTSSSTTVNETSNVTSSETTNLTETRGITANTSRQPSSDGGLKINHSEDDMSIPRNDSRE